MRSKAAVVLLGMSVVLLASSAWSQETTGTIVGTVKDTSGAVVAGASTAGIVQCGVRTQRQRTGQRHHQIRREWVSW